MHHAEKFVHTLIFFLLAVIPFFFLPFTQDYYDTTKWYTLIALALFTLILWSVRYLRGKHMHITLSPLFVGCGAVTVVSAASLFFSSPNKMEALLGPFGPLTFLALTVLAMFMPAVSGDNGKVTLRWSFYTMISLLALISVYQYFGLGKIMLPGVAFLADPLWTPTGSTVTTIALLLLAVPALTGDAVHALKEKKEIHGSFLVIMSLVTLAGLGISLWQFLPRLGMTLLPQTTGWAIALETLKNLKSAVFGVGAENFLTAFSAGRPVSYNLTPLWSVRFTASSNFLFHVTTVYGLLGTAAGVLFLRSFFTKQYRKFASYSLYTLLAIFLFIPPSLTILVAAVIVYFITPRQGHKELQIKPLSHVWGQSAFLIVLTVVSVASLYGLFRSYRAETDFYTSLLSAQANNGTKTYNEQIKAIQGNPYISRYHIIYSQTNLALATSLANTLSNQTGTATDSAKAKDKQLIAQLVQQSIREAKVAAKLNPSNILAWENMARVYEQLIDLAQGADTWADASYKQAIMIDPTNPVLRLELGAVSMKRKNLTDAITSFQKAASLKPNYANAYYNLAYAYKASGDMDAAIRALTQTQQLLDEKSNEYTVVTQELETLKNTTAGTPKNLQDAQKTLKTETISPTPSVKPIISPPISLPGDSGPNMTNP